MESESLTQSLSCLPWGMPISSKVAGPFAGFDGVAAAFAAGPGEWSVLGGRPDPACAGPFCPGPWPLPGPGLGEFDGPGPKPLATLDCLGTGGGTELSLSGLPPDATGALDNRCLPYGCGTSDAGRELVRAE